MQIEGFCCHMNSAVQVIGESYSGVVRNHRLPNPGNSSCTTVELNILKRPHPGGPENHAVSAARSGNAAAGTVGMRRCCPIVVAPLVQWRSDIWAILLVI